MDIFLCMNMYMYSKRTFLQIVLTTGWSKNKQSNEHLYKEDLKFQLNYFEDLVNKYKFRIFNLGSLSVLFK